MLTLAATERGLVVSTDELDADPYLLSCANGTLDLRSGELRDADPADLLTHGTGIAYDADADCPRWRRFLQEIFDGDRELISFVHRFVGHCLTGDIREHVLAVLHGSGCNGKTTFVETLKRLLGGHAVTAAFDTFIHARSDRAPRNDLARLHGARLV